MRKKKNKIKGKERRPQEKGSCEEKDEDEKLRVML